MRMFRVLGVLCISFVLAIGLGTTVYADTTLSQVFSQIEQQYGLPAGVLGKIANVESGGNATVCASSSSACGMFQWTTTSWYAASKALYGSSLDLNQRSNPVTAAKVTAFALKQAQNQNGALIQQANINMTLGLYMCHFLGSAGCSHFFQAYIQNSNASASAIFPKEASSNPTIFNGRSLTQVLNLLGQRLGTVGASVNVAGNFSDQNGFSLAYSDADVAPSDFMSPTFVPPAQDPAFTYQTNYATGAQSLAAPTQLTQPVITQIAKPTSAAPTSQPTSAQVTQQTSTSQPIASSANEQQTTGTGTSETGTTGFTPAALIIAQPSTVAQGGTVLLSWTSVGTNASASCQVMENGTLFAQGTEGSKTVQTASLQKGTTAFVLTCNPQSNQPLQQSVSITVN